MSECVTTVIPYQWLLLFINAEIRYYTGETCHQTPTHYSSGAVFAVSPEKIGPRVVLVLQVASPDDHQLAVNGQ